MGPCASSAKEINRPPRVRYDREPEDTASLKKVNLPILDFFGQLANVKVSKCNLSSIGLEFGIEGVTKTHCPLRRLDSKHKSYWKINHLFDCMMSEYTLRTRFLVIEAVDDQNATLGMLKINLYVIWNGPFHQDFKLDLAEGGSCRVSFNFRLSQGIHVQLENTLTQLVPSEVLMDGTRLTFTMGAIMGQKTEPSSFAHHVCIEDKEGTSVGLFGKFPAARNVNKHSIQWSKLEGYEELPAFNQKIAYYEIYSSSMHFTFWRVQTGIIDPAEPHYQPEGSCYIPISRLMDMEYVVKKDAVTNITYFHRQIELTEKLWLHGKENGLAHLKFNFQMQSHQKQMQSCVRTEEGILTSTPVFINYAGKECEEIAAISKINTEIQKEFINLDDLAEKQGHFDSLKQIVLRIHGLLSEQLVILQKTNKESSLLYNYKHEDDLMKGQRLLIFFAFKVLSYIREDISYIKAICWDILVTILRRGEFRLSHMGFNKEEQVLLKQHDHNDHIKFKKEIALKYLELLKELLKETLRCLEFKGHEAEQGFAQKFCAYAYFRIPLFREHILEIIREQNDPEIPEWRGIEINLYEQNQPRPDEDEFYDHTFDWEKNFLLPLAENERYHNFTHTLERILLQEKWKLRLGRRKNAFFKFLDNLVQEIMYVCVNSKHIKWHTLPGYNKLLHAFLNELKTIRIRSYPETLCKCCIQLLANEKLLNIMVVLLLKKSNVNDPETVAMAFELIDQFFKSIKANERPIPGTFDFKFLLNGIRIVLASEFEASISKVLLFIYDNFNIFSQEFSLELALFLMTKYFYRFFFHWSFNLRHIFQMFVFTKISRYDHVTSTEISARTNQTAYANSLVLALRQRYESVLQEIRDQIEPQAPRRNINRFYERDLYKKMQVKIDRIRNGQFKSHKTVQEQLNSKPEKFLFPSSHSNLEKIAFQTPKKLLYFKQHEMKLQQIQHYNMGYVKVSLVEYNEIVALTKEALLVDPNYTPEIRVRKITDDAELLDSTEEEW